MQHYFSKNENLELYEKDKHHIINVMRMKIRDSFILIYDSIFYECEIKNINKKNIKFEVINKTSKYKNKRPKIIFATSLIKENKLDFMLQKLTEIGVDVIQPFISERSIISIDNERFDRKKERYKMILKEASEQSHRIDIPAIKDLIDFNYLLKTDYDLKLVLSLSDNRENIKDLFKNKIEYDTIMVVVGPEGGFSKEEENKFIENNFKLISLGDNILRSETAAIYAMSIIDNSLR